ncbi:MAG TPA: hypothetical protein DCS63_02555 [Elusimicrobia bacterium]|nr:hypothetical protein [Elusimicrobiota bacterium]
MVDLRAELKSDINLLDQKVGQLDQKFGQLDQKVGQLDQKVGQLDQKTTSLGIELAKTQLRIDRFENNIMTTLRDFKSEILSAIDAFAGEARDYRRKDLERGHMLMVQDDKLQNHETRITVLETAK